MSIIYEWSTQDLDTPKHGLNSETTISILALVTVEDGTRSRELTGAVQRTDHFPSIFRGGSYERVPFAIWAKSRSRHEVFPKGHTFIVIGDNSESNRR